MAHPSGMGHATGGAYTKGRDRSQPSMSLLDSAGIPATRLERLHVGSLPSLGPLHDVELHGLAFLQALETIRIDRRVMHENIFCQ